MKWRCVCDCGNEHFPSIKNLNSGNVRSCGCIFKSKRSHNKPTNEIFGDYRARAKRKNILFDIPKDVFLKLITQNCGYCGDGPKNEKKSIQHPAFQYNGLDRKNNNLGYTLENSVTCCKECNIAKGEMSIDQFEQMIVKIYKNCPWVNKT